jgi:phi13 family phage major tail protein
MADNKVRFGISNVRYALETEDGFGEWKMLAGAVQVSFEPQGSQNIFYADNYGYYVQNPAAQDQISIELADLTDEAKQDLLGYVLDETSGLLLEPVNAVRKPFAMGYQVEGDGTILRGVRYGGTLARPSEAHNTTSDSTDPDTLTVEGTFVGKTFTVDGNEVPVIAAAVQNKGDQLDAFNAFWEAVPQPGIAAGEASVTADATLSALSIGALSLDPAFAAGTTVYSATTSNASNAITATAADAEAEVSITANGAAVESGSTATWQEGQNVVVIRVVNGDSEKVYTVFVTKE